MASLTSSGTGTLVASNGRLHRKVPVAQLHPSRGWPVQSCGRWTQSLQPQHTRRCQQSTACSAALVAAPPAPDAVSTLKAQLIEALQGVDRGIFGLPAAKRDHILGLVKQLEEHNPVAAPTEQLGMCHGNWKLMFSTITIMGVKRTKLGLREFIRLGDFTQIIDTDKSEAVNVVDFSVAGLSMVGGALTITASYTPVSPQRVAIAFKQASLVPVQLQKLFEANYDLLLGIFNPDGHLDITYLDNTHRVGRDDKGNVFLLARVK